MEYFMNGCLCENWREAKAFVVLLLLPPMPSHSATWIVCHSMQRVQNNQNRRMKNKPILFILASYFTRTASFRNHETRINSERSVTWSVWFHRSCSSSLFVLRPQCSFQRPSPHVFSVTSFRLISFSINLLVWSHWHCSTLLPKTSWKQCSINFGTYLTSHIWTSFAAIFHLHTWTTSGLCPHWLTLTWTVSFVPIHRLRQQGSLQSVFVFCRVNYSISLNHLLTCVHPVFDFIEWEHDWPVVIDLPIRRSLQGIHRI